MNNNPVYQEKKNRFFDMLFDRDPDRVPIYATAEAWVTRNAGFTFQETHVYNLPKLKEALDWLNDNIYLDAIWGTTLQHPVKMLNLFGEGHYNINDDGFQFVTGRAKLMEETEYPEMIADYNRFLREKIIPRKFPIFTKISKEEAADLLAEAVKEFAYWAGMNTELTKYGEEELGLPMVCKAAFRQPIDQILDAYRDFSGLFVDLRRRPQEVLELIETIYPAMRGKALRAGINPEDPDGVIFNPLHTATFLNKKQFEKFYFPVMKRLQEDINGAGMQILYFCEDDWTPFMDIIQDLPDGNNAFMFESGDPVYIKSRISKKGCYVGGIDTELLKMGTVEQCVDRAKWCLENLAPGGRYIFAPTKSFINKNDAKVENYAAVCAYIHENGKY